MCVYGCVNMSVSALRSQSVVSLEAGHKGCHESPDVGADSWIQVLRKSRMCSQLLNHPSSSGYALTGCTISLGPNLNFFSCKMMIRLWVLQHDCLDLVKLDDQGLL